MNALTYTHVRNNLASVMDEAENSRAPILVTRSGHAPVVMLSVDEYQSMTETLHLMSSPANLKRLNQALADYEAGQTEEHDLQGA